MFSYEITTPTDGRKGFFKLLEQLAQEHQVFIINRRDGENVALIAESDLKSFYQGKIKPQTIEELKQELELSGEQE